MEIRKLNTLRAIAALIVFVTHFSDITHWLGGILGGGSGAYGVMLFFLLSGFLMSYLYFGKEFNQQSIKIYLLARAGRILPLYVVVVLASYFLTLAGNDSLYSISDFNSLVSHLLFLEGESVLWSIPAEIHFYFIFLIFWSFSRDRQGYIYLLSLAVIIILFLTNFPKIHGDALGVPYNYFSILRTLPYFFVGVVFGMHYRDFKVPSYLRSHWFVLTLCLIPFLYPELTLVTSDAKRKMWLSYEVLIVMSSVFYCVVFLVPNNNVFLANKLGDFIGKMSFSLYLLHMPIIEKVNEFDLVVELKLVLSIALSFLAAYLSFKYFEKPMANFIRNRRCHSSTPEKPKANVAC